MQKRATRKQEARTQKTIIHLSASVTLLVRTRGAARPPQVRVPEHLPEPSLLQFCSRRMPCSRVLLPLARSTGSPAPESADSRGSAPCPAAAVTASWDGAENAPALRPSCLLLPLRGLACPARACCPSTPAARVASRSAKQVTSTPQHIISRPCAHPPTSSTPRLQPSCTPAPARHER